MSERSTKPCNCGEHHRLDEFPPRSIVRYKEDKYRSRLNKIIRVGEVGTVVEWSQYTGYLYYRVEFADGQRENFDPCELEAVVP